MTRINLVHPSYLTNKHLMAEYRELPRIFTSVRKLISENKTPNDVNISPTYILGTGHNKFFYNKISFLINRYKKLYIELKNRGYNLDDKIYNSIIKDAENIPKIWSESYAPTPEEIYLNMARLCLKSNLKQVTNELGLI